MRSAALLLLSLALPACGDNNNDNNDGNARSDSLPSCALRVEVTGGASIRFTGKDDAGCATQHSFESGLDVSFVGIDGKSAIALVVEAVAEGETGSDYAASVAVTSTGKGRWQGGGCSASLSEHRLIETEASELGELRHYQVSGEGNCNEPLESVPAGTATATVSPFAFRAEFTWRD